MYIPIAIPSTIRNEIDKNNNVSGSLFVGN
jgi:hypothetical protein